MSVLAIASARKSSARQSLEIVCQVFVAGHKCGGLLGRIAIGVPLTKLTLTKDGLRGPVMIDYLWPRFHIIHATACRLLIDEVKLTMELFKSIFSRKLGYKLVNSLVVVLPRVLIGHLIHSWPSSEGSAHRNHDADLGLTFSAVVPEGKLLFLVGDVDVGNMTEVGTGGEAFVVHPDQNL